MIILESRYNPLRNIFFLLRDIKSAKQLSNDQILFINSHLAKAGIVHESPSELETLLDMLIKLKQEYYGQSQA